MKTSEEHFFKLRSLPKTQDGNLTITVSTCQFSLQASICMTLNCIKKETQESYEQKYYLHVILTCSELDHYTKMPIYLSETWNGNYSACYNVGVNVQREITSDISTCVEAINMPSVLSCLINTPVTSVIVNRRLEWKPCTMTL